METPEEPFLGMRLGIVLRRLRGKAELNQVQAAQRAGLSQAMLSRWEQGDLARVNLAKLDRLSRTYGSQLSEVFKLVEEAPADSLKQVQAWLATLPGTT